ncbi:MAG: hypothetical protein AB7J35_13780 [Dehalococcoidia bacterium]
MADLQFRCNQVEQFIAWELPDWVKRQGANADGPVTVEVLHPDREMDGSCRWCGGRKNETVTVEGGRIA